MRNIKFRAWDVEDKEFLDVGRLYQEDEIYVVEEHPDCGDRVLFVGESGGERKNEVELMQYTGIRDKNGAEIYEGDIVEWLDRNFDAAFGNSDGPDWFHRTKLIKFIDQGFNVPQGIIRELKVIGNIYENPELLGDS